MNFETYRASIAGAVAARRFEHGRPGAVVGGEGRLAPGTQMRPTAGRRRGRLGARLSPSGGRRSAERRRLVCRAGREMSNEPLKQEWETIARALLR